ncbi:MAG: hypothetical protein HC881_23095 [Leptolyngbyaceae cyanobacterium SL_7_1]|nr:hypothetical protein [Leptolyngbyaceae cyanobacterium SL_7_1]
MKLFSSFVIPLIRPLSGLRILLIVAVGMGGCDSQGKLNPFCLSLPGRLASVHSIQSPRRVGCTVELQGTVGDRVPLVEAQLYQLRDGEDAVWVLTSDTNLQSGTIVRIRGRVHFQPTSSSDPTQGEVYIEEQAQLDSGS